MASVVNTALSPLGIKPFSGPPYSDRGLSDQSMKASAPLQAAGQSFLNLSQGQADPNNPYKALFASIGKETGTNDPFGGTAGNSTNPGELTGSYSDIFNNLKGHTEKARSNALSQLNAHMSARGLGNSSEARAHQAYLNSQFDNHLSDTMSQLQGQQHQERLSTLQNFINSLQGFGAMGSNMINGNVQNLNQNAQAATQRTNQGNAALGSAIGLGLGAGGFNPFGSSNSGGDGSGYATNANGTIAQYGPSPFMANSYANPQQWSSFYNPFGAY